MCVCVCVGVLALASVITLWSQLITTIHHIFNSVESTKQVDAVVLDSAKAFDIVPHQRLLHHRLKYLGVQGSLLSWISHFLTQRDQIVVVQGLLARSVAHCYF